MHTIYMGDICLLKAEQMASEGQGPTKYQDLNYGATVTDANSLASLFDTSGFEALKAAGTLPLEVYAGRSRSIEIIFDKTGESPTVFVKDEMGSLFDFHEITLGSLFNRTIFEEA